MRSTAHSATTALTNREVWPLAIVTSNHTQDDSTASKGQEAQGYRHTVQHLQSKATNASTWPAALVWSVHNTD